MSGIVAIINWDNPAVDEELVERMLDRVPHRSTEGRTVLSGVHCAMGHALHATTARERAAAQPLHDARRGLSVVADARLDNRDELLDLLQGGRHPELSDPALILLGYDRWGAELAEHLIGDFAFVIWDSTRREVYAARDPFGIRPLFYHASPARLALASEVEQILALDGVRWDIEDCVVLDDLLGIYQHHGKTFFRDVAPIVPGHYLLAREGSAREARYWQPPREELRLKRAEEYYEEFRRLFRLSVAARLDSDRPLVACLSGGLDSSSIVCVADQIYGHGGDGRPPLTMASAVYPGLDCDESPFIDAVARGVRFPSERYDGTHWDPIEEETIYVANPWGAGYSGVSTAWRRIAQREGARVVLSGSGGDELLFEDGVFSDLAARGRWLRLLRETALAPNYSTHTQGYWLQDAVRAAAPPWLRRMYRWLRPRRLTPPPPWLGPHLREVWSEPPPEEPMPHRWASHTQKSTFLGITDAHTCWTVEQVGFRAARRGVQLCFPFLDARLVQFVCAVPYHHRLPGGQMKVLLREALGHLLPPELARRPITTFDTAVRLHVDRIVRNQSFVLSDGTWLSAPYVERSGVQELLERFADARPGTSALDSGITAHNILLFERWLRHLQNVRCPARTSGRKCAASAAQRA